MPDIKSALQQALEQGKREYLNKTLNEWDEDEQKQIKGEVMPAPAKNLFGITNNVSRETFNYVRDNPNRTIGEIRSAMTAKGFKDSTVTTLVYQMAVAEMLTKSPIDSTFTAAVPEFKPFNIGKIRKAAKLKQQAEDKAKIAAFGKRELKKLVVIKRRTAEDVAKAQEAAGIGALTVNVEGRKIGTFKQHAAWKPEDTVDTLSLGQAKAVHAYLQKLFGAL